MLQKRLVSPWSLLIPQSQRSTAGWVSSMLHPGTYLLSSGEFLWLLCTKYPAARVWMVLPNTSKVGTHLSASKIAPKSQGFETKHAKWET